MTNNIRHGLVLGFLDLAAIYLDSAGEFGLMVDLDPFGIRVFQEPSGQLVLEFTPKFVQIYQEIKQYLDVPMNTLIQALISASQLKFRDPAIASRVGQIISDLGPLGFIMKQIDEEFGKHRPSIENVEWICKRYAGCLSQIKSKYFYRHEFSSLEIAGIRLLSDLFGNISIQAVIDGIPLRDPISILRRISRNIKFIMCVVVCDQLGSYLKY